MIEAEVERLRAARDLVVEELTALQGRRARGRARRARRPARRPPDAAAGRHARRTPRGNGSSSATTTPNGRCRRSSRSSRASSTRWRTNTCAIARPTWSRWSSASSRALGRLGGDPSTTPPPQAPRDFAGEDPLVLVANDIAPADMLKFRRSVFTGFVTDVGGRNSHTAIVARSMDIPAVVGAREASRIVTPGRLDHHRRRRRRRDRQPLAHRARGIPLPPTPGRARARAAAIACATRRPSRSTAQPVELLANIELPERRPGGAGRGRGGRRAVPQRVPVHEPRRQPARRGGAVRGLQQGGEGAGRPAGHDPHGGHRRRQAARPHAAADGAPRPQAEPGARVCAPSAGACPSPRCSASSCAPSCGRACTARCGCWCRWWRSCARCGS